MPLQGKIKLPKNCEKTVEKLRKILLLAIIPIITLLLGIKIKSLSKLIRKKSKYGVKKILLIIVLCNLAIYLRGFSFLNSLYKSDFVH